MMEVAVQVLLLEDCARVEPNGLNRFTFRCSRREFRQLHEAAEAKGLTPSELVRDQLYAGGVLVLTEGATRPDLVDDDESDEEIEQKYQQALRRVKARP